VSERSCSAIQQIFRKLVSLFEKIGLLNELLASVSVYYFTNFSSLHEELRQVKVFLKTG
jgi:hypothetical protein